MRNWFHSRETKLKLLVIATAALMVIAVVVNGDPQVRAGNKPYKGKVVVGDMAEPIDGCPTHYVEVK